MFKMWFWNFALLYIQAKLDKKAILSRLPEYGAGIEKAWRDFWAELEPDRSKNYLKDIPKLNIQFIDEISHGIASIVIKGELGQFKNTEDYLLVNYIHVYFGDEIIFFGDELTEYQLLCSVKNYFIKNKFVILRNVDKKEYLKRVGKLYQKYLSELKLYYENLC